MADFERALDETRASVTPEMEREYEQIQDSLKQDAHSASAASASSRPGMLTPRGPKGLSCSAVQPARPSISAPVTRKGKRQGEP